jgi:hypothetical protein
MDRRSFRIQLAYTMMFKNDYAFHKVVGELPACLLKGEVVHQVWKAHAIKFSG